MPTENRFNIFSLKLHVHIVVNSFSNEQCKERDELRRSIRNSTWLVKTTQSNHRPSCHSFNRTATITSKAILIDTRKNVVKPVNSKQKKPKTKISTKFLQNFYTKKIVINELIKTRTEALTVTSFDPPH